MGTVNDRFQSYNIEMVEVTSGRFWKPYKDVDARLRTQASVLSGRRGGKRRYAARAAAAGEVLESNESLLGAKVVHSAQAQPGHQGADPAGGDNVGTRRHIPAKIVREGFELLSLAIRPFCDQAFELELARDLEKLLSYPLTSWEAVATGRAKHALERVRLPGSASTPPASSRSSPQVGNLCSP